MKHIDADKLKALLEARIEAGLDGYGGNLKRLLENIDSLQQEQPQVADASKMEQPDLEREIIRYKVPFSDDKEYLNETTLDSIARHFYEFGLNARKK